MNRIVGLFQRFILYVSVLWKKWWFISVLQIVRSISFFFQRFAELMVNRNNFFFEKLNDEVIFGLYYKGIWKLLPMGVKFKFDFCDVLLETTVTNLNTMKLLLLHNFLLFLTNSFLWFSPQRQTFAIQFGWTRFVSSCSLNNWLLHFLFSFIARKALVFELTQSLFAEPAWQLK